MKAYGVVRKPKPTYNVVEHVFKIEMVNPKENEEVTIRRDNRDVSVHTIERKSVHFPVAQLQSSRMSSSSRRHRLFGPYESRSLTKNKKIDSSPFQEDSVGELPPNSVKKQQDVENLAMPLLRKLISRESEIKERARLKSESKQCSPTLRHAEIQEASTPFHKFNSQQNTLQIPTRDIASHCHKEYKDQAATKSRSQPSQNLLFEMPSHIHQQLSFRDDCSLSSSSVVNIGCCGEDSQTQEKSIKIVHKRVNPFQFVLAQSIDKIYVPPREQSFQKKPIFGNVQEKVEQSISGKIQGQLHYKEDKIQSKPLMAETEKQNHVNKKYNVTVFELKSYDPFEF